MVIIGRDLPISISMCLVGLPVEFKDIFKWESSDLGVYHRHICEHKLGIPPTTNLLCAEKELLVVLVKITKKETYELSVVEIIK